jgi:hypothetical protein
VSCSHTAAKLTEEAGIEAESVHISAFRQAVLQGHWTEVDRLLRTIDSDYDRHEAVRSLGCVRLEQPDFIQRSTASSSADNIIWRYWSPSSRARLCPFCATSWFPHVAAPSNCMPCRGSRGYPSREYTDNRNSLMMCTDPADLRSRASWSGSEGDSRLKLLVDLQGPSPRFLRRPC